MVSRKSHPKSRNGCQNCKKRRIKCDEIQPRCSNCVKHSIECDFADPSKVIHTESPRSPRKRGSESKSTVTRTTSNQSLGESPEPSQANFSDSPSMNLPCLHMEDLELLHHFTTDTCFTLSDRPQSHIMWQVTVPQVAFEHDFLMRGILAISALHLSFQRPSRREYYTNLAVRHQDAALGTFRTLMSKPDQSNCDAFFALSSLIVVYGFESPKASNSLGLFDYKGEHSDEWLPLIRGVNSVIMSLWPWIKTGRLCGLLHDHEQELPQTGLPTILDEQLTHLEQFCEQAPGGEELIGMYKRGVLMLRECFVRINNKSSYECEVSISFLWPVIIPQDFIDRLHTRDPYTLIILAHYCVILHHLEGYWWMNGWAMQILTFIHRELDESMQFWLQWPTSVVGVDDKILTNGRNPIQRTRINSTYEATGDRAMSMAKEPDKIKSDAAVIAPTIASPEDLR